MLKVATLSRWHVHADEYAEKFQSFENVKLVAHWDENPEEGKPFAAKYNMEFEPDLDKLLSRSDIDAVCLNAPTNRHKEIIVKAANSGKHIFTEKVMALTNAESAEIKEAIEKNGVKFCISFPHRTWSHNLFAKKIVEENLLGKISYIRTRNAHSGASAGWLPSHFYDKKECGGGAMIDLGAHPMYLILWLLGLPDEISSTFTSVTGHEVEDNAVCTMKYPNGLIAVSETSFVTSDSPKVLEIHGTEGSIVIVEDKIWSLSEKIKEPFDMPKPLPDAVTQFINGIIKNEKIIFDLNEAIDLTKIMEAAYKSHEKGGFVKVV